MTVMRGVRRIGVPALGAVRTYWGTSALLVLAVVVALAAIVPVTSLLHSGAALTPRLTLPGAGGALAAPGWAPPATSPGGTQQAAIGGLFASLFCAMVAAGGVAVLTLISLFGARASDRATEVVVRRAVGASRRLLAGSTLLEGLALASVALLLGSAAGMFVARLAAESWPGSLVPGGAVPAAVAVVSIGIVVVLCAMLPLIYARERRVADAPAKPLELFLPAIQLGLSLVVLTGGTLLARQATIGFERSRLPSAAGEVFRKSADTSTPAGRAARYAALLDELSAGGNFDTVSLTSTGGLLGLGTVSSVTTDCGQCAEGGLFFPWHVVPATHQFMSADSFHALGVRVIAGRGITSKDRWGTEPVAVVSRGLALRHFQRGEAIGRKILLGDDSWTWHTVVGIVDDRPVRGLGGTLQPPFTVYASVLQHPAAAVDLLLRTRSRAPVDATAVAAVNRALAAAGRPPAHVRESELVAAEALPLRWFARWFGFEGWAMLALACGGTFALMRLWVLSLLTELGLRRAMGARRWQLIAFVLLRAAGVGLAGVAVGIWFGPAVWSALGAVVAGLPGWDTATVARFALILTGTAVAGALLPALKAARTSPASLLSWI
ncbi:MAG: FtsX-like permease family protein [Gemmatimonadales bacterium]